MYTHESGQRIEGFKFKDYKLEYLMPHRIIQLFDTLVEATEFKETISPESIQQLESKIIFDIPPKPQNRSNVGFEICFTGFESTKRCSLEMEAESSGMIVRGKVTKKLTALCIGPNAGPSKFKQALEDDIIIMTENEFSMLLSTGVLPPPPSRDQY
ncbi:MAG: BRCT domain-containing protein [Vibrio sp.]